MLTPPLSVFPNDKGNQFDFKPWDTDGFSELTKLSRYRGKSVWTVLCYIFLVIAVQWNSREIYNYQCIAVKGSKNTL